jgi:tetratricopeptide (TPR) repeat protein
VGLSALIPGSGKMYAGETGDGLQSLLLIGALAALAGTSFHADGVGSWRGWLYASFGGLMYAGNLYGSAVSARRWNRKQEEALGEDLLALFSPCWDGKPMLAELALLCLLGGGSPDAESASLPDADPALTLAESFLASGAPAQAVTEYKRFLFFHPQDSRAAEVRSRLGLCLLAEGRYQAGMAVLRQAAATQPGLELRLEVVRALLQAGRLAEAEQELLGLQAFSGGPERDIWLHLALLRIEQGRWAEAEEALLRASPRVTCGPCAALAEAGGQRKSRAQPACCRLCCRRAGRAYAGIGDGLNALAVNGGIAILAAAAAVNRYYPEAVLLVLFPLRRYYTGNIGNAGRLAERRNAAAEREYRRRVLEALWRLHAAIAALRGAAGRQVSTR